MPVRSRAGPELPVSTRHLAPVAGRRAVTVGTRLRGPLAGNLRHGTNIPNNLPTVRPVCPV